jgi:hypothetical protein
VPSTSQEKHHHITAELGYSETWWRKYDFYFAYCEAAFDMRYIHDYHVTWHKSQAAEPTGSLASAQPAAVAAVSTVVAAAGAGAGWVKQELPTDSFTQVIGSRVWAVTSGTFMMGCHAAEPNML